MQSPTIKVDFIDFWPDLLKRDNYFFHLLSRKYDVLVDESDPDIVFMSCYDMNKVRYEGHRCKKVFFSGENRGLQSVHGGRWADVGLDYDVTLTFDKTEGKNTYLPLFVLFMNWFDVPYNHNRDMAFLANMDSLFEPLGDSEALLQQKTQGCCFLAKNPTAAERVNFCKEAQKHLRVDCAGPVLNNCPEIGGRGDQKQKIDFIEKYRSIIAFENSKHPGYLTEKALHGVCTRCVPIYWGADQIFDYFNEQNVISVGSSGDWPVAIQRLQRILSDDNEYLSMVSQPALKRIVLDEFAPERILSVIDG